MTDIPNPKVLPILLELVTNIHNYDISTFKTRLRTALDIVDTRAVEDQTDFSFKQRRSDDA